MTVPENLTARLVALVQEPLQFAALCWPHTQLYTRQKEILLSLRDNVGTCVPACNQSGKTRIAAVAALWFFLSRTPARVVLCSASEKQLEHNLWSELTHLIRTSAVPLPLVVNHLLVKKRRSWNSGDVEPRDHIVAHVTNCLESFQGFHLPNDRPRVLAIFDQASAIDDEFMAAAESWAHKTLLIGNPLNSHSFFCRYCLTGDVTDPAGGPGLLRKVIRIAARDIPNVYAGMEWTARGLPGPPPHVMPGLLSYAEYLQRLQYWDEAQRTMRLDGEFYFGGDARLFTREMLDRAMNADTWQQLTARERRVQAIGVDVAAGGRDKTCWTLADPYGVIEQIVMNTPDTMQIVGQTVALIKEHRLFPGRVAIDAGGGGDQLADRLKEVGRRVKVIGFGEAALAPQSYRNRRAELYGKLQQRLGLAHQQVFALPPDAYELRQELAVLPIRYDGEGRLALPPKNAVGGPGGEKSIRQLLGHSPDRADSLVLAVAILDHYKYELDPTEVEYVYTSPSKPMTAADWAAMPEEFKEHFTGSSDAWSLRYGWD